MNDENPYQSPQAASLPPPTAPMGTADGLPPDFQDRSTGLMVFGVLEILAGLFAALLIPTMIVGLLMAPNRAMVRPAAMIPMVLMYGLAALGGVWLGVGSIRARRWARSLSLLLGWIWLVVGILATVGMLLAMPSIAGTQPQPLPPSAAFAFFGIMLATAGCFYVVAPIVLILFYGRSRSRRSRSRECRSTHLAQGGAAVGLLLAAYAVWLRRYFKAPLGSLMGEKTGS